MIDFGKNDNKSFNDLAAKLITKVLQRDFKMVSPTDPENTYTLEHIKVNEPDDNPVEYMKRKLVGDQMVMRVYADIIELDKNGRKVRTIEKQVFLGSVPHRTRVGTYLLGNDYSTTSQPRNNPSIYTTLSNDGNAQSAFQLGKGHAFKITVTDAGSVRMKVGDYTIHAVPFLKIMGFSDDELRRALGDKLYGKNERLNMPVFYRDMNKAFFYDKPEFTQLSDYDKDSKIKEYMTEKTTIDPDTTDMLLGIRGEAVTKPVLEQVLRKLMAVYRKEETGDDRWDLRTSKILTPSHLFADRLEKQLPRMLFGMESKLKRNKDVKKSVTNFMTKSMQDTILMSDLSRLDPQYNLMGAILTGKTITPVGEGAISSVDLVEDKGRQYHPTQTGVMDMTFSPQGMAIGLSLRAAPGLVVGEDGTPHIKLKSLSSGRVKPYTLPEAAKLNIKMPGEGTKGNVKVLYGYKEKTVSADKATHVFAEPMYADSLQMVPFPSGMQGPRGIMAATQFAQAVPLVHREAPRVGAEHYGKKRPASEILGHDYLERLGLTSPVTGTVMSVSSTSIRLKSDGGQERVVKTNEVMPFQYNTGIRITPVPGLKKGDKIKEGQPLFTTSMHTGAGELAPGVHLKTMWGVDSEGYGVEDGIVISESAAVNKLTSEHFYRVEINPNPGETVDYKKVRSLYQHRYTPDQFRNIDEQTGIVKKGSIVKYGDLIATMISERESSDMDAVLGRLSRSIGSDLMDTSKVWDKFHEGTVIAVETSGRKTVVVVATTEAAEVGSKLTGRFGNKGIVSKILPDDQMPFDMDTKEPIEIILSPMSVPTRVNPNQISEASLGETGKTYSFKHFDTGRSIVDVATVELEKAGLPGSGKHKVRDPRTGITSEMGVGKGYFLKLFSPEKSISARGLSGSYDSNLQPVKGGKEGSKGLGLMEFYALLGHNSKNLLKEFGTIKSEKNLDFWRNYEMGLANMPKAEPYTFGKFNAYMTAAGAKLNRSSEGFALMPVTDDATSELSEGRGVRSADTFKGGTTDAIEKGLFDPKLTGGRRGSLWSEYQLSDGVPHPLLSQILRVYLNVGKKEWDNYIAVNNGKELKKQLDALDLNAVEKRIRASIEEGKDLSNNTQSLRFLVNLKKLGKYKLSQFIITKIPVLPPKFRPITSMPDGTKTVSDLNYFYMDVISSDKLLKDSQGMPSTEVEARSNLIQSVNAFAGLTDPRSPALKEKGVRGAMQYIAGVSSPKEGFFLSKMMKRQMINTGRARIIPDPTADMNEVGIPEYLAWNTYEQHLRKELRGMGYTPDKITSMISTKDPTAKRALEKVLRENYVLVNRAPTMHRYGILSGKPKIVDGNFISIPTAFEAPLNADYDGDEVTIHAPVTAKGREDAAKMMLSNNPFTGYSPYNLTTGMDSEAVAGLYKKSLEDVTGFKAWWKEHMPEDIEYNIPMTKKNAEKVMRELGKKYKGDVYAKKVSDLNRIGFRWAAELGLTMSLDDIRPIAGTRELMSSYKKKIGEAEGDARNSLIGELQGKMLDSVKATGVKSSIATMLTAGAKGSPVQASAILASPVVFTDPRTRESTLIEGNTADGYSFSDHLKMNARARDEMIKTKLSVAGPGDLYKQMAFNTRQAAITEEDCGTGNGIDINPKTNDFNTDDLIFRLLAKDTGSFKKNTVITPDNLSEFMGFDTITVRSPRTCETARGLCAKCYGVDEEGNLPAIGEHVNVKAINSFSMPISQKALNAKHSVRTFTGDAEQKNLFEQVKGLLTGADTEFAPPVVSRAGVILSVEQNEDKSWLIKTDTGKYKVDYRLNPIVKAGDSVDVGQILAEGASVNTKEIANSLGLGYARQMFSDALNNQILIPGGISPHQRNIEVLAKELYKYVEVVKDTGEWIKGDVITLQEALPFIRENSVDMKLGSVKEGQILGDNIGDHLALDVISEGMIDKFRTSGIKTVKILTDRNMFKPVAKGMSSLPLLDGRDWLENMGFRFLKRNITQALSSGYKQPLDPATAPLTAYVSNIWD